MGNIYCLMGKSASGKDTIYNRLLAMERLHLRRVVPYTTRPMRSGETDGQTYVFCTEQQVADFEAAGKIIELRAYHTMYGIWKYFTADDGQICLAESDYLMIGTLEAYEQIRDYFWHGQSVSGVCGSRRRTASSACAGSGTCAGSAQICGDVPQISGG